MRKRAVSGGALAEFVEAGRAAHDTPASSKEGGARGGGVHVGIRTVERCGASHLERVTVAAREGKSVVGNGEVSDLDLVAGVGGDAVHVDDAPSR
jgi:hypothetical protein